MAAAARQVGYPDMNCVIMKVMTTRVNPSGPRVHDPAMQVRSAAIAAVPLALIDAGAARVVLQQLEARSGLDPVSVAEVASRDWLRAGLWSTSRRPKASSKPSSPPSKAPRT